jgi:arsenate reductase-like glutaredoxin family protein
MAGVFINYRAVDNPLAASLIDSELSRRFGSDLVFRADRSIRSGDDFAASIRHAINNADALIVIIGERWLEINSQTGKRAIDNPSDWTRREIEQAFSRNIPVIPVVVGSARLPSAQELPIEISRLASLQSLELPSSYTEEDVAKLINSLRQRAAPTVITTRSAGVDSDTLAEVSVWTSDDRGENVRDALLDILGIAGFDTVDQAYPVYGSWYQRIFVRQVGMDAQDKLAQLAEKVERAAELKYIDTPRSQTDEREASAIARLVESLGGTDEAVIRTSSILLIKLEGRVVSWVLSEDEIATLSANPQLMRSPIEILEALPNLRHVFDWKTDKEFPRAIE